MATVAKTYRLFIGGKWEGGKETMPVLDKFTGETIGQVPVADKAAVRDGTPSVRVRPGRDELVVGVWMMRQGEDAVVARRLREVLERKS